MSHPAPGAAVAATSRSPAGSAGGTAGASRALATTFAAYGPPGPTCRRAATWLFVRMCPSAPPAPVRGPSSPPPLPVAAPARLRARARCPVARTFRQLARARRDATAQPVQEDPIRRRWLGRIRVIHQQCKALRSIWRTTPRERRRDVVALAGVRCRNGLAGREGGRMQFQHGSLDSVAGCYRNAVGTITHGEVGDGRPEAIVLPARPESGCWIGAGPGQNHVQPSPSGRSRSTRPAGCPPAVPVRQHVAELVTKECHEPPMSASQLAPPRVEQAGSTSVQNLRGATDRGQSEKPGETRG